MSTIAEMARQRSSGWQCPHCGQKRRRGGDPDPCFGYLPGVLFACCGHGGLADPDVSQAGYIYFENGVIVRFEKCTVERVKP